MMARHIKKEEIKYPDIKKCGEITTLLVIGRKEFFLNCEFCENKFLHLETFIQHMYDDHLNEFQPLKFEDMNCSAKIESDEGAQCNFRDFERVELELDSVETNNELAKCEEVTPESNMDENIYDINSCDGSIDTEPSVKSSGEVDSSVFVADKQPADLKKMFPVNKMQAIFSSYMEYPALWDKKGGITKNRSEKQRLFQRIASDVGMPNEWKNIQLLLGKLRVKLQTEIIKKKMDESKGRLYTPTWYTDLPFFLKQRPSTSNPNNRETAKIFIPLSTLITDEQIAILAELYKGFPCLWDEKDIKYRFGNRRQEALEVVRKEFNTRSGLNLTQQDLKSEIGKMRKICSKEKRQKLTCKKLNTVYISTCPFYDHIAFLEVDVPPFECSICGTLLSGIDYPQT